MRTVFRGKGSFVAVIALAMGGLLVGASGLATADSKVSKKVDRLWRAKCASCHGKDGKGQTEQGQKMKVQDMTSAKWQKAITDDQIRKAIREGIDKTEDGVKKEMPGLKDELTKEKIDMLIGRVRAFAP